MDEKKVLPSLTNIQQKILECAEDHIEFIVLFGSRARGKMHRGSDTDIAIKTNIQNEVDRGKLRIRLISALNGPKVRVDIITIEDVDWELRYRIARDGIVLFNRDDSWQEFVEAVIKYYPDYHQFFGQILEQSLGRRKR